MAKQVVKTHTRKSKSGKIEVVKQHIRDRVKANKKRKLQIEEPREAASAPVRRKTLLGNDTIETEKIRKEEKEKKFVTRKGKVIDNPVSYDFLKNKYEKRFPITWKIMTSGKWKDVGDKKQAVLTNLEWKDLLKEHAGLIVNMSKKYSYGENYGNRFNESRAIAEAGFVEGVNAYGKYFDKDKPIDFLNVTFSYVKGRLKENLANRLNAGLRIPAHLQKPYRDYIQVKEDFKAKGIENPADDLIAKELQKLWTKKLFYGQYKLAEERRYKIEKTFGKGKKKVVKIVEGTFNDLSKERQKEEKEKDLIPLDNYVIVKREGVEENKEERHVKNMQKIEDKFNKEEEKLEEQLLLSQTMNEKDKKFGESIIKQKQEKYDDLIKEKEKIQSDKIKKVIELENEQNNLNEDVKKAIKLLNLLKGEKDRLDPDKKKKYAKHQRLYKKMKDRLDLISTPEYHNNIVKTENLKIRDFEEKINEAKKELFLVKEFYQPIDEQEYEKRKNDIEKRKQQEIQSETHRYNKDTSSGYIPGVKDRIKEFKEIESIKELPLNLEIKTEDSNTQLQDIIMRPNELNQDDLTELIEQHTYAKNYLKENINSLTPIYRDIFGMYIGLSENNPETEDRLWGELLTQEEIVNILHDKHRFILKEPQKFLEVFNNVRDENKHIFINSVPFVLDKYRTNYNNLVTDYKNWLNKKPKEGRKKVKVEPVAFKKRLNEWKKAKVKARKEWDKWRKQKKYKFTQDESRKKLLQIKTKLKAREEDIPKKFFFKKGTDKKKMESWKIKMPQPFYESQEARKKYIREVILDSSDIMRRITPIKVVKDLLSAHRKLVENGIALTKAVESDLGYEINLIEKSLYNVLFFIENIFSVGDNVDL